MEAVATRGVVLVRGELALCALIAAASAVTVAAHGPPGECVLEAAFPGGAACRHR